MLSCASRSDRNRMRGRLTSCRLGVEEALGRRRVRHDRVGERNVCLQMARLRFIGESFVKIAVRRMRRGKSFVSYSMSSLMLLSTLIRILVKIREKKEIFAMLGSYLECSRNFAKLEKISKHRPGRSLLSDRLTLDDLKTKLCYVKVRARQTSAKLRFRLSLV